MSSLSQLNQLTNRILDAPPNDHGTIHSAASDLFHFLVTISGIDISDDKNRETILSGNGKAIGLTWAAMCIQDFMRTKRFMDAVLTAVNTRLKMKPGKPVQILYAGTGPFATLILPLTARFKSGQVRFILLEINEQSFHCLQTIIAAFHLEAYISHIENADAVTWSVPSDMIPDIFISETMNSGLTKEPQVPICLNIIPQLPASTIMIPEKIVLDAALVNPSKKMKYKTGESGIDDSVYLLGTVFQADRELFLQHAEAYKKAGNTYSFEEKIITIPGNIINNFSHLNILTRIYLYQGIELGSDESALTLPLKLCEMHDPFVDKISFWYTCGSQPGIKYEYVANQQIHS